MRQKRIKAIEAELKRVGVDESTLGRRGVKVMDVGGSLVALYEVKMGPLWTGLPKTCLDRLKAQSGGRGTHDGLSWVWHEVFPEYLEETVDNAVTALVEAVNTGSIKEVQGLLKKYVKDGLDVYYEADEDELGPCVCFGTTVGILECDVGTAPEGRWDWLVSEVSGA